MKQRLAFLIAEDDSNDFFLLKRAVEKLGLSCDIQWVRDGFEAKSYLKGEGEFMDRQKCPIPQILFLDLKMPRMDGKDLLQWLSDHKQYRVIPTIVLSSSNLQSDIASVYSLGANSFFQKPSGFTELCALVKLIHDYWLVALKPTVEIDND